MYQTELDGQHYELGTSGFLYRSSKLMYDLETKSMWSTLQGKPVIGPLVGKDISLNRRHVVTTTWGEWKKQHPTTRVLSLDTGHKRNYGEGVAYRNYFATDELMFDVPVSDKRLKNKASVFALRIESGGTTEQLAISSEFLRANTLHHERLGKTQLVVFTDESGGNRAYDTGDVRFVSWGGTISVDSKATDDEGQDWKVTETGIEREGTVLARLPAHRVFWFGWVSQFPETRLVK